MSFFSRITIVAALLCTSLSVSADNTDALIGEVLSLAGVGKQLEEISHFAKNEIETRKEALAESDYRSLKNGMTSVFASEKLRQTVEKSLAQAARDARFAAWRDTLKQPLITKMAQLENQASGEAAFRELSAYAEKLQQFPPPPARVDLVTRLAKATYATDLAMDSHIAVTKTLLRLINPSLPENKRLDAKKEERILTDLRSQLAENLKDVAMITYLYTYRDVSDEELNQYTALYETGPGQWATESIVKAIRAALDVAVP